MLSHQKHFLDVVDLPVHDLLTSRVDQPQKISLGKWIVPAGLRQYD